MDFIETPSQLQRFRRKKTRENAQQSDWDTGTRILSRNRLKEEKVLKFEL